MKILKKRKKQKRLVLKIFLSLALIFIGVSFFVISIQLPDLSDINLIKDRVKFGGLEIYDRTGRYLIYQTGFRHQWVDYDEISDKIVKSTLAAEDSEFYTHHGISLKGIFRAIWLNLKSRSLSYGGSTITQQLVRNLFLTQQKSIWRKIKEIILAIKLEKKYSKEQILTYYLNVVYYGAGNIGIEAASEFYFGKRAKDLSWDEAASLAAIPKSPSNYSPTNEENLKRLKIRRDYILQRLVELGWLNKDDLSFYQKKPLVSLKKTFRSLLAPHFVQEVLNQLQIMYPDQKLESLGLKVYTTLDVEMQKVAENTVWQHALENEKKYNGKNAALMAMDPLTGEVLALVGSRNFFDEEIDGQVNVPFSFRQPGSAFKPISYAALFELGYPDVTILFDVPTNFGTDDKPYLPKNFDKKYRGPVTVRQSLAQSLNIPSIKVFYLAIPDRVIDLARKAGMSYLKDFNYYGLSLGIGTAEVKMKDLLRFYGALANDGILVTQSLIKQIVNSEGKIIYLYQPKKERILSENSARMVTDILKDPIARIGLFQSSLNLTIFPGYEIALKTGTTQNFVDAWTFGYSKNLVVGVWAGNSDGTPMTSESSSIVAALPIFHDFMQTMIDKGYITKDNFIPPQKYIYDKPMLNGSYISNYGIHDILFYVDRFNPLGPIPGFTSTDPQFINWENGVKRWFSGIIEN